MATILQRLKLLESSVRSLNSGELALSNRLSALEAKQAGDDQQEVATAEKLAALRNDLDALAKQVGDEGDVEVPTAGPATIEVTEEIEGEEGMADKSKFTVHSEQPKPEDIERSTITVTGPDGVPQVKEAGKPVLDEADGKFYSSAAGFEGSQGDKVEVSTVNFDDANPPKESKPFSETMEIPDKENPASAGRQTIEVTEEEDA